MSKIIKVIFVFALILGIAKVIDSFWLGGKYLTWKIYKTDSDSSKPSQLLQLENISGDVDPITKAQIIPPPAYYSVRRDDGSSCNVTGFMSSGSGRFVIVAKKSYTTGDMICGGRVEDVSRGKVIINFSGKKQVYRAGQRIESGFSAVKTKLFCPREPKIIDNDRYLLFVPAGLNPSKRYPIILAFSPGGSAITLIRHWQSIADKYKYLILASKEFRNGVGTTSIFKALIDDLDEIFNVYPVDKNKVIASGMSGGGMASHLISYEYSGYIRAIIPNVGSMHPYCLKNKDRYPRGKLAVFLASPTDSNYEYMKRDRKILEKAGWKTKWIEFSGGHITAPVTVYEKAIRWLDYEL